MRPSTLLLFCVLLSITGHAAEWIEISDFEKSSGQAFRLVPELETKLLLVKVDHSIDGSMKESRRVMVVSEAIKELDIEYGELRTPIQNDEGIRQYYLLSFKRVYVWKEERFDIAISNMAPNGLRISVRGKESGDPTQRLHEFRYTAREISDSEAVALMIESGENLERTLDFLERLESYKIQDLDL